MADSILGGRLSYERSGWIESGVRLEVTPVVNTDDVISVEIEPTLSRVIGFSESGDARVQIPILSTREIKSQFDLPNGMTAAIGGLTETREQEQVNKIPILGDIPVIGRYLFRHTHSEQVQDEVVIFVTVSLADTEAMEPRQGLPQDARLAREYLRRSGTARRMDAPESEMEEQDNPERVVNP